MKSKLTILALTGLFFAQSAFALDETKANSTIILVSSTFNAASMIEIENFMQQEDGIKDEIKNMNQAQAQAYMMKKLMPSIAKRTVNYMSHELIETSCYRNMQDVTDCAIADNYMATDWANLIKGMNKQFATNLSNHYQLNPKTVNWNKSHQNELDAIKRQAIKSRNYINSNDGNPQLMKSLQSITQGIYQDMKATR